jgi:hypothetical protein
VILLLNLLWTLLHLLNIQQVFNASCRVANNEHYVFFFTFASSVEPRGANYLEGCKARAMPRQMLRAGSHLEHTTHLTRTVFCCIFQRPCCCQRDLYACHFRDSWSRLQVGAVSCLLQGHILIDCVLPQYKMAQVRYKSALLSIFGKVKCRLLVGRRLRSPLLHCNSLHLARHHTSMQV